MDIVTDDEKVSKKNESAIHKTIKKVTEDIDSLKMNTAIAALMSMVNEFYTNGVTKGDVEQLLLLLSPFAPHIVEEMWEMLGFAKKYGKMAMQMPWPEYDEAKTVDSEKEIAVQVNGKLKSTVIIPVGADDETVLGIVYANEKIAKLMEGMTVVKTIIIKNKLVNLILKPAKSLLTKPPKTFIILSVKPLFMALEAPQGVFGGREIKCQKSMSRRMSLWTMLSRDSSAAAQRQA